MSLPDRFWAKVDKPDTDSCWVWTGCVDARGYAHYNVGPGLPHGRAHRVAYQDAHGPVPEGLVLDHLCRVRHCVNPAHMEPVTSGENTRRGVTGQHHARKTHCPKGHPYDAANTYNFGPGNRWRGCRACRRIADQEHKQRLLFGVGYRTRYP